ncbi:MAG: hypothetical protein VX527_12440 [Planctomycetota bacterium]|nr:hypothetical protein [Planctomycetota bacterium]
MSRRENISRPHQQKATSVLVVVSLLLFGLSWQAVAQNRRPQRPQHPIDSHRSANRARVPELGQTRPLYQIGDLNKWIETLEIDVANKPVIEIILTHYQDQHREGAERYRLILSNLRPDSSGSDEIEAQKVAARDQLKSIREDITQRYRNGEWGDDHAKMREVLSEATKAIQGQVIALEKAKSDAMNWSGYFAEYGEAYETWNARRHELNLEVETQLQAFLEANQRPHWQMALAENWIRRELPHGELGGESIDLEQLLRARVLDEDARLRAADAIARWKQTVGMLLAEQSSSFDELLRSYIAAGTSGSPTAWLEAAKREAIYRQLIRDANLNALLEVCEALGPEEGPRFQEAVLSQVYPTVFARGRVLRGIDEALAASPALDAEKLASVRELRNDAASWMLEYAYRSQEGFQIEDVNRLISKRRRIAEQFFPAEDMPPQEWTAANKTNREELLAWEEGMMETLRSIIGDARYSRLSGSRTAPAQDGDASRGRGGGRNRRGRGR